MSDQAAIIETWKPVVGYEGIYEVSDLGRVRSLNYARTGELRILVNGVNKRGYHHLGLTKQSIRKNHQVHVLVARAFIEQPVNKDLVDHIDRNPSNNLASNLRWSNSSLNIRNSGIVVKGYSKEGNRWRVQIQSPITHKLEHFGTFRTEELAARVAKCWLVAFKLAYPECYN